MKKLLLFAFTLLWIAPRARAQDTLEIPEGCGSQGELTREVAALRASARSNLESERPAVSLTRDGEDYLLTVELPDGRRSLRDPDCRALFRAAIVIAALGQESSVENVLEASTGRAEKQNEGRAAAPIKSAAEPAKTAEPRATAAESSRETPRAPTRAARRPWLWSDPAHYPRELGLRALLRAELGYGVLPELSGIFGAGVALEYARFAARASLAYQGPPREASREEEQGVSVQGLSASLTAELVAQPWLRPGLGVDYHALRGRGLGGRSPRAAWATQVTLHAGFALRLLRRGPFWLELSARALWAPKPANFTMTPDTRVYRTSPWGLAGGISAGFEFL
jgi:hypothetical protein